jgi:hypothetical protein
MAQEKTLKQQYQEEAQEIRDQVHDSFIGNEDTA